MKCRNLSPLRYPGGKVVLAQLLERVIYRNNLQGCTYLEPFAGGAGAGLKLLAQGHVDRIIINDIDRAVYCFWKSIMSESDEFVDLIKTVPLTIDEWYRQREIYQKPKGHSRLELGFATFYLNRCNRSGIIKGAGPIGGIKQEGKWTIGARFSRSELAARVIEVSSYQDRIEVRKTDAQSLIKGLSIEFPSERIFVYADPPYYVKGSALYLSHYNDLEHANLAETFKAQHDLSWLVTYDDVPRIREIYAGCQMQEFSLRYSAHHSSREGGEVLMAPHSIKLHDGFREALPKAHSTITSVSPVLDAKKERIKLSQDRPRRDKPASKARRRS